MLRPRISKAVVDLADQAKRASERGDYAGAARLYRKVVELLPHSEAEGRRIYYLSSADAHICAHNYQEAIDDCRCAITSDPNYSIAWRWLGLAQLDAGRFAEAESSLLRSLELGPTPTACMYLARLCFKDQNLGDAERYCRYALALDPDFDEAYFNLGCALSSQCRADEALEVFQTACKLDPEYAMAHREAGAVLLEDGRYSEAEIHLQRTLELTPRDERAIELMERLVKARS